MATYSSIRYVSGSGSGAGVTVYANFAAFPGSPSEGDLAYANDTDALYVRKGSSWDRIDSGNESPVILTEPPTSIQSLAINGSTSTVTMAAQDPEGFAINYGIAYKTANNALPSQLASTPSINQSTGAYTFTPSTNQAHAGSFKARLSASDGAKTTTRFVDFSLSFTTTVTYLVVAGGGGGGGGVSAGGGGAGGYRTGTVGLTASTAYSITVGAGGAGAVGDNNGAAGSNSSIGSTIVSIGGGKGGGGAAPEATATVLAGGSGGGGTGYITASVTGAGGNATSGQGYAGGTGIYNGSGWGGAGGGAGAAGGNSTTSGGVAGVGLESSINGTATYYGGGGGAGGYNSAGTPGGNGGGGAGGFRSGTGTAATANTGGGGGGGVSGGAGGSGIVIIRSSIQAVSVSGHSYSTVSGDYVYTFTGNGSITF